jgi:hypothetical protein
MASSPFFQPSGDIGGVFFPRLPRRVVMANADELERLDLLTGFLAYLAVAEHVTEPHFEGMVTTAIAKMQGTSPSTALAYKRRYDQAIKREIDPRNPLLHSITNELTHGPMSFVVSIASAESGDNRRLLRESRQLMAEYARDCRVHGLRMSAGDAVREEKWLSEEEREEERRSGEEELALQ